MVRASCDLDQQQEMLERQLGELSAMRSILGREGWSCVEELEVLIDRYEEGEQVAAEFRSRFPESCSVKMIVEVGRDAMQQEATLHVRMPRGYPGAALACHVTAPKLPRSWEEDATRAMRQIIDRAEEEESECMLQLVEEVQGKLAAVLEDQEVQQAEAQRSATQHRRLQVALLHLDHMRQRASYSRTICAWASSLSLTGRLLFQGSFLIFLLLEGEPQHLAEYLRLHRTVPVDVDSKGRKCREKMMRVLAQRATRERHFTSFREESFPTLDALLSHLQPYPDLAELVRTAASP